MKHLVVQKGKDSNQSLSYKYGSLIGNIKGVLLYGDNIGDMEFRTLAKALFAVLDADNAFDRSTLDSVVKAAKDRGIEIIEEVVTPEFKPGMFIDDEEWVS